MLALGLRLGGLGGVFFYGGQLLWGFGVVEERGVERGWLDLTYRVGNCRFW